VDYEEAYGLVKGKGADLDELLPGDLVATTNLRDLRRVLEMILVRTYCDWWAGSPDPNISQAIHGHIVKLQQKDRPLSIIRRTAAALAWVYTRLDHDSHDAYLLLEHVLRDLPEKDDGRTVPVAARGDMENTLSTWREDRGIPPHLEKLNLYEQEAWAEIARWEVRPASNWDGIWSTAAAARDVAMDQVPDVLMTAMMDALGGGLKMAQDAAAFAVRRQATVDAVRAVGHEVDSVRDLRGVPLEVLDRISAQSLTHGKIAAGLEGAGMGWGGLMFVAADIPALITLNLRFIGQIGATYGFECDTEQEKQFVLNLLGYSAADQGARVAFAHHLNQIALAEARRMPWRFMDQFAMVQVVKKVAEAMGIRLTHAKLAQLVPVLGAAVGAGVNYSFTHDNLVAARMMYRKRHMMEKCM